MTTKASRLKGCMYGLAIGDAMGAPVEFMKRGTFAPVTGYRGGGIFNLNSGEWTDDTAMTLCLAQSLIDSNGFNPIDQLEKYLMWIDNGYMSSSGKAIGLGQTCGRSLVRYRRIRQPYTDIKHEKFSGNGSLMRLAPICLYYVNDLIKAVHYAALSSKTTHGSPIAVDSCRYFAYVIVHLLLGYEKNMIFSNQFRHDVHQFFKDAPLHKELESIVNGDFMRKNEDEIYSTGYVIHSLEAAMWCFYHTESFKEAILKAVNLGDDADTAGAIMGQLGGAYYSYDNIPEKWVKELSKYELIKFATNKLIDGKS